MIHTVAARTVTFAVLCLSLILSCATAANQEDPADKLPHSQTGQGRNDIASAWLVAPSTRYDHGVLGDALEAAGLEVLQRGGTRLRVELTADVFEDLIPRVQDLDGDGRDEIVLVRSNHQVGARLSIWGIRQGELQEIAAGPAIGMGHRWLNPIGAADFDGDARVEIAYVQTPHIGGILRLFEYRDSDLAEQYRAEGFSNHRIGSTDLSSMHEIVDYDGNGRPDIQVMDSTQRYIRVMSIRDGLLVEIDRLAASR